MTLELLSGLMVKVSLPAPPRILTVAPVTTPLMATVAPVPPLPPASVAEPLACTLAPAGTVRLPVAVRLMVPPELVDTARLPSVMAPVLVTRMLPVMREMLVNP